MERILLRISEAAEALGFARSTVYNLIRERQIPSCKVGKSIRIPVSALQDWARQKGMEFSTPTPCRKYGTDRPQSKEARA